MIESVYMKHCAKTSFAWAARGNLEEKLSEQSSNVIRVPFIFHSHFYPYEVAHIMELLVIVFISRVPGNKD